MRNDILSRLINDAVTKLGRDMAESMLRVRPGLDFVATFGQAIEQGALLLTTWRDGFLQSLASGAVKRALGDEARITVFWELGNPTDRSTSQRLVMNLATNGTELFTFVTPTGETPIKSRADIMSMLPANFLFHLCRHLTSPSGAKYLVGDVEGQAADTLGTSHPDSN